MPSPQTQHKMEGGFFLNVVIGQCTAIFQLFASENQPLLVRGDALLVLNLGLDILDVITWLNLQGYGLPSQSLHKNLHLCTMSAGYKHS